MKEKLPPPVTLNSTKAELWEELKCARNEVDAQQLEIIGLRARADRGDNEVNLLRYQVKAIRAVLDLEVR
jgi:hypothetical protein